MENEGALVEAEGQIICSICVVGVALQQRSMGHRQKRDEGFRRESRVPHEEGGVREGEERERGRENGKSAVEGDALHRIGGKDDTKEKIAVGRSQCEKRAKRL